MARIRLTRPEMAKFSSHMGTVLFKDGVSVDHVSAAEARLLGSITAVEVINDDNETVGKAGLGQEHANLRSKKAEVEKPLTPDQEKPNAPEEILQPDVKVEPIKSEEDPDDVVAAELEQKVSDLEDAVQDETVSEPAEALSREALETIADEEGIAGLRKIGEPLNVKSNSVEGLIEKLVAAQKVA